MQELFFAGEQTNPAITNPKLETPITATESENNFDILAKILLPEEDHIASYEEQIFIMLDRMYQKFEDYGGQILELSSTNFGNVFRNSIKKYPIILRREDPVAVIDAFANNTSIQLNPRRDANACYVGNQFQFADNWRTVLEEGFLYLDKLGMVTIVAYDDFSGVEIKQPEVDNSQYKTNTNRAGDRMVSGEFKSKDIRAILLRFPISKYPANLMTEEELEKLEEVQELEEDLEELRAEKSSSNSGKIKEIQNKIANTRMYRMIVFDNR